MLLSVLAAALVFGPGQASARPPAKHENYVPGEVIVRYHAGTGPAARSSVESRAGTDSEGNLPGGSRKLEIEDGDSVRETVLELRQDPRVAHAVPNYVARATALTPNDPGFGLQWNFWGPAGINMPEAWSLASSRGAPGGRGAVVAVPIPELPIGASGLSTVRRTCSHSFAATTSFRTTAIQST